MVFRLMNVKMAVVCVRPKRAHNYERELALCE
jgi:hypothetical protein